MEKKDMSYFFYTPKKIYGIMSSHASEVTFTVSSLEETLPEVKCCTLFVWSALRPLLLSYAKAILLLWRHVIRNEMTREGCKLNNIWLCDSHCLSCLVYTCARVLWQVVKLHLRRTLKQSLYLVFLAYSDNFVRGQMSTAVSQNLPWHYGLYFPKEKGCIIDAIPVYCKYIASKLSKKDREEVFC